MAADRGGIVSEVDSEDWESGRNRERRETVRRYHVLKDFEEDFGAAKAATSDPEERRRLDEEMYAYRCAHREEDARLGKRSRGRGISIAMRQNLWARWLEVTAEHWRIAEAAHHDIRARRRDDAIMDELRASLVVCTAATAAVEALYEDVRYLIPLRPRRAHRAHQMSDGIAVTFGLHADQERKLRGDLKELFRHRDESLHGHTESKPPRAHPLGFRTGAEIAVFNAVECRRYLQTALTALGFADEPSAPANRWVARWATERSAYHAQVVRPIREEFAAATT